MLLTALIAASLGLGVLIGLALGALGGGGSILTVPALVFLLGLTAQEATTGSLVIVGVTAALACVEHARDRHTLWAKGFTLAAIGVPTSILGSQLNRRVDPDVLLLAFAALMVLAAVGMLLRSRAPHEAAEAAEAPATATAIGAHLGWLSLAAAGLGIGFLTGFLGVGGGFIVVPALVVLLGISMPVAVGTSLLVIALNSAVALGARASHGTFVWEVIVPFTVAAVVGSLAGKRVADRVEANTLTRTFAAVLLLVAGYVAVNALLGTV